MEVKTVKMDGAVQTLCRMCDTRCAVNVHLKDGVIADITPFDGHPVNQGKICPRGSAAIDQFYHIDRITKPLKKQADEIAAKIDDLRKSYGARSIGVWKGEGLGFHQQEEYARRFVSALGSPNYFSNDSACYNSRFLGYSLVTGFWNSFPEFSDADLILLFGTNPPMCHPPNSQMPAAAVPNWLSSTRG